MKKILIGLGIGAIIGIIDVVPMIIQNLTWDANISAFTMWIVAGFFVSTSNLKINSVIKGIIISLLCLLPVGIIIAWSEPMSLIPISIMTLILGAILGYSINKFTLKLTKGEIK